jgi:molecular chaperone DnaK
MSRAMGREAGTPAILGIDFGTTNSEVAVFRSGAPEVLANRDGQKVIPSVVFIDEDGRHHVGQAAKNVVILHPDRTVKSIKRDLGTRRVFQIGGREYAPEELASYVFSSLKEAAEAVLGREVQQAVVTVPAYFDDPRRQATRQAAALAGLEVVRLVNEPTAAALAYGVDNRRAGTILVYDLGGGTFDVSILHAGDSVFQVLATRGDARLGGDDFDWDLAQVLLARFREETGIDLKEDRLALQKIIQAAEEAKIRLSEAARTKVEIPFLAVQKAQPLHLGTSLTRQELDGLIASYVERTLLLTRGCLQDAGLEPGEVDRVLLVGGSTRIPAVRKAVEDLFGRPAETGVNPEEVVACGAAVQAGIMSGKAARMVLVDVTPLSLGVETADQKMVILVPRNTPLPARVQALFTTVSDFQKSATITVLQGERPRAADNIRLGSFRLEDIQPARQGEADIEITFDIDVEGIVHVSAQDLSTGSRRWIALEGTTQLSQDKVDGILAEARAAELEDLYAK